MDKTLENAKSVWVIENNGQFYKVPTSLDARIYTPDIENARFFDKESAKQLNGGKHNIVEYKIIKASELEALICKTRIDEVHNFKEFMDTILD